MASVTKVMTAILVLHAHPLGGGSGPTFTMTAANHAAYIHDATHDDSNLDVVAGEHLTERQLLEALMIPSADNIADYLARWDAGSIPAFREEDERDGEGARPEGTHYTDASGLNPASRSTAVDQAILGSYAMNVPGMISVEDHPTMVFPVTGEVGNLQPGCGDRRSDRPQVRLHIRLAGLPRDSPRRAVGGHTVLIISSTLGQPLNLPQVGTIDLELLDSATSALEVRPILRAGQPVAAVVAGWPSERPTVVVAGHPATVVGWGGLPVSTVVKASIQYIRGAPAAGRRAQPWRPCRCRHREGCRHPLSRRSTASSLRLARLVSSRRSRLDHDDLERKLSIEIRAGSRLVGQSRSGLRRARAGAGALRRGRDGAGGTADAPQRG